MSDLLPGMRLTWHFGAPRWEMLTRDKAHYCEIELHRPSWQWRIICRSEGTWRHEQFHVFGDINHLAKFHGTDELHERLIRDAGSMIVAASWIEGRDGAPLDGRYWKRLYWEQKRAAEGIAAQVMTSDLEARGYGQPKEASDTPPDLFRRVSKGE